MNRPSKNCVSRTWLAFGGLLALGITYFIVRELPSMRRELHLLRM